MLQDVHSRKISQSIDCPAGATTVIIPNAANEWHYIHELIGDLQAAGFIEVFAVMNSTEVRRSLAKFDLTQGQGITLQDEPGEDAALDVTGGDFVGSVHWSIRN